MSSEGLPIDPLEPSKGENAKRMNAHSLKAF
jgi:hypothetical protein